MSWALNKGGLFLLIALALVAGCARSPEAKKARHLERGNRYFTQQQYREAILEYRNALRIEGTNAHAMRQLGLAYYQTGELQQAFDYLLKAQALEPDQLDVRLTLATIYLLGGRAEEAAREAEAVLQKEPKSLPALTLLAGAARTPEQVDTALQRLEAVRADAETHARFHLALAGLYLRKQDAAAAEHAFKEAVAREPGSIEAHTGLGNLYLSRRDSRRDAVQAEREFKAAAELAPPESPARLKLAELYLLLNRPDEARAVVKEITEQAPGHLPAWRLLAQINLAEGQLDEALKAVDVVLKKNPADPEAHGLRGRVHLAKADAPQAIQEFQTALKAQPRLAPIRYQLAVAQLQAGNPHQAKTELMAVITHAPDLTEAHLLLARLNIQTGAAQLAIADLEKFIARRPRVLDAYALLSAAYLAQRDALKATAVGHKLATVAPTDPRGPYLIGVALLGQSQRAAARQHLERSLTLGPGFLDPLAQLVRLAVAEQHPEAAVERVKRQIALVPTSGVHRALLGDTYAAQRQTALAEAAYLEAVELEPRLIDAYLRLGNLYAASGRYDQAAAKVQEAVTADSRNTSALMLLGVIQETKGDIPQARAAYERALAINPRFAPAANNLAWLDSERGGDMERALRLAQTAKEQAPDDPRISDTLGWILYKRGEYQRALGLLKESAARLPANPQVQYHLGMAYDRIGEKDNARTALTAAVSSPEAFAGKDEARKALATFAK